MKTVESFFLLLLMSFCTSCDTDNGLNPFSSESGQNASVFGVVKQKSTNKGIANVNVMLGSNFVTTDGNGKYSFINIPKGSYKVTVDHKDWDKFNTELSFEKNININDISLTWKYPKIQSASSEIKVYLSGKVYEYTVAVSDEGGDNTITNVNISYNTIFNGNRRSANLWYNSSSNAWTGVTEKLNVFDFITDYTITAYDKDGNIGKK